ncbi:thioredoxin [Propionispora vibrioides]|uniref:Thioredoxin n=1 Tax=Propionispora vibrioides TaxID=112903 RepID=A0A1H8P6L4_9FIRM|nr:thioredoxin [Propionispora vibrioides]SEO37565.1 thioredoxin [Propionispora vibrioides]
MSTIVNANRENFQEEVIESATPVLVDFWAPWCGYCTKLSPILDELATEHASKMKVVKVNVDENRSLAQDYGVMSLPTMLLFKDGVQTEKLMGYMPKSAINAKLSPLL